MTIGERRFSQIQKSVGPGEYSPEKSELFTKPKTRVVNFDHPVGRQNYVSSPDLGPGTYDD